MIKKINSYVTQSAFSKASLQILWGSRGTGKSSLIKATLNAFKTSNLRLIEIQKNDLQDINSYLDVVGSYFTNFDGERDELHTAAKLFATTRGSRSGQTAKQFYNYYSD